MKKEFTNTDILAIYDVLNQLGTRSNLLCSDADVYWAISINTESFGKKASQTRKIIADVVDKHFNEKNSHKDKDQDGNEIKVLNEDIKEKVLKEINEDIVKIQNKRIKVDIETFSEEALKKMVKANENKLTFLDIKVLREFITKE